MQVSGGTDTSNQPKTTNFFRSQSFKLLEKKKKKKMITYSIISHRDDRGNSYTPITWYTQLPNLFLPSRNCYQKQGGEREREKREGEKKESEKRRSS
jgi:hypothetical protein